jgi:hypothetical protein
MQVSDRERLGLKAIAVMSFDKLRDGGSNCEEALDIGDQSGPRPAAQTDLGAWYLGDAAQRQKARAG